VPAKPLLLLAMLLGACTYDTHFEDCTVRCTTDMECPEGLACEVEGYCRAPGAAGTCTAVLETPPSCAGLAATCGSNADEDCCSTATPIPGGTFFRSYDLAADGMYPSMGYPATVSPFVLDRFEVTVGRFRKFVEAGRGTRANPPPASAGARFLNGAAAQGGWNSAWDGSLAADSSALVAAVKCDASFQTWTDTPGGTEEMPINCVTWYEAFAFCEWDGGFSPTEAEWNFAAAGGDEQRAYPWSNPAGSTTIDCSYANYRSDIPTGAYCVNGTIGGVNTVGSTSPKGDGRWGQVGFAGNVWEWVLDHQNTYETPCTDCAQLASSASRVYRGGGFDAWGSLQRTNYRLGRVPSFRHPALGVRCARQVP